MTSAPAAGCLVNLSARGVRTRRRLALAAAVVGVGALVALDRTGVATRWRGLLFVPYWIAALGWFQASAQTCVRLAARGAREFGDGVSEHRDAALADALRRKARRLHVVAFTTAAGATLLSFLV